MSCTADHADLSFFRKTSGKTVLALFLAAGLLTLMLFSWKMGLSELGISINDIFQVICG